MLQILAKFFRRLLNFIDNVCHVVGFTAVGTDGNFISCWVNSWGWQNMSAPVE